MISFALVGILALAALAYVASALIEPDHAAPAGRDPVEADLERRARAALVAIVDLENERDVGKLSHHDYDVLVSGYEDEALAALRDLDDVRSGAAADALERDVAAVRDRLRTRSSSTPPSEPR